MNEQWRFLRGTYWFVPPMYLPAMQLEAGSIAPTHMTDQTVWQITGYSDGYFWGNCAVLIYPADGVPTAAPQPRRMLGSITPDGAVQISFMNTGTLAAATAIQGWGQMREDGSKWLFEMQMASGVTSLTTHWACMERTAEGLPFWNKLPGTHYSVPAFLQAAGFEVPESAS